MSSYIPKVHHRVKGTHKIPCGVGHRWSSEQITSTHGWDRVTCIPCLKHKP